MKVGFIGLGIMGTRMAANLQARGHRLVVFNRTPERAQPLVATGATWAPSPAEVAADVDVVITMLSDPDAVAEAALGPDGLLHRLRPGNMWINSSTVNPSFARQMDARSRSRGVHYLDAPVSGSKDVAARAELTFMVGGDPADLEACRPLLSGMGVRIVHVGGPGMGSSLKLVSNLLGGVAMAAFAEGAALGQALGIAPQTIFDTLGGGPMVAPLIAAKRHKIEQGDFDPEFAMRWLQKDLHLASVSGYEVGSPMPVVNAAKELYRLAMRDGHADQDFSAICAFVSGTPAEATRTRAYLAPSVREAVDVSK
jgi:3-hydroxyisobutyrate dehydrogenase-like beta-hydroxyacid dehydrogenase